MKNSKQTVVPAKAGNIKKGDKIMKILGFEVSGKKVVGQKEDGTKWTRLDVVGKSLNGVEAVKLQLWGREVVEDREDGTSVKYMIYRASRVKKDSDLRKKWWIPVSTNNPKLVTTTSKSGNKYQEVIPENVLPGWDIKAFYAPEIGKIGVSIKVKEVLI